MYDSNLDLVFSALSDGTRRSMLAQLAEGEMNATELAKPHAMSQPAISKHLGVLERAGLIERNRRGRIHYFRVRSEVADHAASWIRTYTAIWKQQFDAVEQYLNTNKEDGDVD